MLQLGQEMKYLARHLPGIEAMCLHYATVGACDELKRDLVNLIVERAMYDDRPADAPPIRTQEEFAALAEPGWRRLSAASQEVCGLVAQVLAAYQDLARQLAGRQRAILQQGQYLTPRRVGQGSEDGVRSAEDM